MKQSGILGMLKLGLILAAFAAAACVMLAFVYNGTLRIIEQRQVEDRKVALESLFPDADNFTEIDKNDITSPDSAVTIESAFSAMKNGEIIGAAVNLSRKGFSGDIKIMVGVSVDGKITGVKIIEQTETPGLGAHAANSKYFVDRANGITFYGQFTGKSVNDPFRVRDDVAVITASTVTSVAVSSSVKAAGLAAAAWFTGDKVDVVTTTRGGTE